jgi:tetratricopeptide (TPR) repeat protein
LLARIPESGCEAKAGKQHEETHMSLFASDWNELFQEMDISLRYRIVPVSASKAEFLAVSNKFETQVCVRVGFEHIAYGNLRDSVASFTHALAIEPSCLNAFVGRAMAHERMLDYEQAHRNYDRAAQLDPSYALALCGRGWTGLALGKTRAALDDCAKGVSLAPTHSAPHTNLGSARTVAGNMTGALVEYNKANELAKSDRERATVAVNRGVLRYIQGLWEKAAADLKKGIGLYEPPSCWSHFLLWHCHARRGDRSTGDVNLDAHLSLFKREPKGEHSGWFAAVGGLLLGKVSEETTLSMLDSARPGRAPCRAILSEAPSPGRCCRSLDRENKATAVARCLHQLPWRGVLAEAEVEAVR